MTLCAAPAAVRCRYCRAFRGQSCTSASMRPCRPHKIRRRDALAVAAHSDPVLDAFFVQSGPCGLCGVEGLGARHRVVDAIAGALAAGEDPETAAWDYNLPPGAVEAVRLWSERWPGAWR